MRGASIIPAVLPRRKNHAPSRSSVRATRTAGLGDDVRGRRPSHHWVCGHVAAVQLVNVYPSEVVYLLQSSHEGRSGLSNSGQS